MDAAALPGDGARAPLGARDTSDERIVPQFVRLAPTESRRIVMRMTRPGTGPVWNTMPAHVHERRSEAYPRLDPPQDQAVMHPMGEPEETRHVAVRNAESVPSPSRSIHAGAGTASHAFVRAMAGDGVDHADVDTVGLDVLR